jgi:PAS domain S-box-containing protein
VAPPSTGSFDLLIVEADGVSRQALGNCLEGRPFAVTACGSLAEAEAWIRTRRFDAAAVALDLPDAVVASSEAGGAIAVTRLRELAPAIAVVGLATLADRLVGVDAMERGAEDYLVKEQYEPRLVERSLLLAIDRRRTLSELEAVQEQWRRHALFFASVSDAIVVADNDDRITDCNPAAERVFGFTRAEMIGRTPEIFRSGLDHPRLRDEILSAVRREGRWFGEIPFVRKDGTPGVNEALVVPIRDAEGRIVGTFGANRDVTQRRRLEEDLRHAQALEAVGRLAGGVAHDFNNLLTTILGYSDVMMQDLAEGDPLRSSVREIRRAGERAAALTRQLLAFGRRQVFAAQVVDLNAVVGKAAERMRRAAGEGVEVLLDLDPAPTLGVRLDETLLEQLLLNLAANAVDAMPRGGRLLMTTRAVRLTVDAGGPTGARPGDYAELRFEDTGIGMDTETRRHLFEPFFSTKEKGVGRGLGLASVYGTVTQVGGHIEVESAPGAGTSFRILLPRAPERPSGEHQAAKLARREAALPAREPGGSEAILLVEDDAMVRRLARDVLVGRGYTVLEAVSAEEALTTLAAATGGVDVLLTDLFLSGASGIDLAQEFSRRCPAGRVVLMSGYADEEALQAGMPGAAGYLQKPFTADQLARRVRRALDSAAHR